MSKKIIKLTENELKQIIHEAVMPMLNEMDAATYSRIYNASRSTKLKNQQGIYQTIINNKKTINNDDIIRRARELESKVQAHWLKNFIGKKFKFYGEDRLGLVADVILTFKKIKKLDYHKTILIGDIVFNDTQISGDGILINFTTNKIQYKEKGSRYAYNLEIDNRFKTLWDELLNQLKSALDSRNK